MTNRRQALQKAWYDRSYREGLVNPNIINPSYECGYVDGFNDAWDLLLSEIRSLVADLYTTNHIHENLGDRAHNAAVERLRELVLDD